MSVPPDSTTSAFNSLRLQTSQFKTLWKEIAITLRRNDPTTYTLKDGLARVEDSRKGRVGGNDENNTYVTSYNTLSPEAESKTEALTLTDSDANVTAHDSPGRKIRKLCSSGEEAQTSDREM